MSNAVVHAVRDVLSTSRHARMLLAMVAERLGPAGLLEEANKKTRLTLYRREETGALVPWPLIRMNTKGRIGFVVAITGPAEPPPREGTAPNLRNLGPGQIMIHNGPESITVTYGDDGRWMECSRSHTLDRWAGLLEALASGGANKVELLATYLADLGPRHEGPGRVLCPAVMPAEVSTLWRVGLTALRLALFEERIPRPARVVVADGHTGEAIGFGATREEALAVWRSNVEVLNPRPAYATQPQGDVEEDVVEHHDDEQGGIHMHVRMAGNRVDGPLPEFTPEEAPAVILDLPLNPHPEHPWGVWLPLVGEHGEVVFGLKHEDAAGFTLVGEDLVGLVDLEALPASLDAVAIPETPTRSAEMVARFGEMPHYPACAMAYHMLDGDTGLPAPPRFDRGSRSMVFKIQDFDGADLRAKVLRLRMI